MRTVQLILGVVAAIVLLFPAYSSLYVDYLWFSHMGYKSVFMTILKTKVAIFLIVGAFLFGAIFSNARIAFRNTESTISATAKNLTYGLALVFSLILGYGLTGGWREILLFLNSTPFELKDPIFGRDLAFFFFSLPFYQYLWSVVFFAIVLGLIASGVIYLLYSRPVVRREEPEEPSYGLREIELQIPELSGKSLSHLSVLGGMLLLVLAINFILDRYSILYSTRGEVYGAGYADVSIQLPIYTVLAVLCLLTGLLFFVSTYMKNYKFPLAGVALLIVVSILGNLVVGAVQQYKVEPDEYNLEKPFIENNIAFTREAFGLNDIQEVDYPARYNLSYGDLQRNNATIENIRLWDWRPLLRTQRQLQTIRTYYEFNDADVDRYTVNGDYRQVMVSVREFDITQLEEGSRSWVSRHLIYTHGFGLTMSPVRDVSKEGLPVLYIKDIPPESEIFNVSSPQIYYGELTDDYAVVKTTNREFDYPKGEENAYTTYSGRGGIELSSAIRKAAMALNYGTVKLLISQSLKPESRILIHRNIEDREQSLAPFLMYDQDPYAVLYGGKTHWLHDAYTVSDRYPYSEPFGSINYIRNSVKVATDAYNGDVTFYVTSREDPVISTYMKVFPGLFKPFEEMPEDLKKHIRYPLDFFSIQASRYSTYHMEDPKVFYTKEDPWEVPSEIYEESAESMEPYYLITKLPGEKSEEFILLLPFTPRGKDNMIAWMAARNDMPMYGETIIFNFPKEKLIYGPMQIESRIDQNSEISQLFTLWGQSGSKVIRGNLLVVPVKDSLLYIEPVYLRADKPEAIPELRRVIVAFGDQVVMEKTLEESLEAVFGRKVKKKAEEEAKREEKSVSQLIDEAMGHYTMAQEHLREGNWSGYGQEQSRLREVLEELANRSEEG